jgi:four helix bundle protein
MAPFERLLAWRASHSLAVAIYRQTRGWPIEERYGLTVQLRRAASAIPTNIAEGSAKRGSREFRRFLDVAIGSFAEVTCLLLLARDLGYLSASAHGELETARSQAGKLTWRLYQPVSRRALK